VTWALAPAHNFCQAQVGHCRSAPRVPRLPCNEMPDKNQDHGMSKCMSCHGSGEYPTESGVLDCPDCGGSGALPSRKVLVEWRTGDIERRYSRSQDSVSTDVAWLLAELRSARGALNEIIALAHDVSDENSIAFRIRSVANRALGLYGRARSDEGE
jgi:hypothetical protein